MRPHFRRALILARALWLTTASALVAATAMAEDVDPPEPPSSFGLDLGTVLRSPGTPLSTYGVARLAAKRAPTVAEAEADHDKAAAEADAATSQLMPKVQLSARYTWLSPIDNDPLMPSTGDTAAARQAATQLQDPVARGLWEAQLDQLEGLSQARIEIPQNQFALRATVSYPVSHAFAQILPLVVAADHAAQAKAVQIEVARRDAELKAVQVYLQHGLARGALAVAEASVGQAQTDLRRARARLSAGAGSRPDVLRFRAQLAAAQRRVAERRAAVSASGAALQTLLDLDRAGPYALGESLTDPPPQRYRLPASKLVSRAHARRPELRVLALLEQARDDQARSETSAYLPRLDVQAQADYANPNSLYTPPGDTFRGSFQVSAILSWSPDAAWTGHHRRRAARAEVARVKAAEKRLRDGVRIEVTTARANYRAGFAAMRAARRQVLAATEAYAAQRRAYELGVTDATAVIAAEQQLSEARLGLLSSGVELRLREQRLRRALGEPLSVRPGVTHKAPGNRIPSEALVRR